MNTPKIRFKGFKDDWEQRKVSDITNSYSGGTPKSGTSEYYDGNIPFIRSGEIYSDKTELFISELGMNYSSAKRVHIGDILYALYGATSGEVSRAKLDGAINQAILAIIPNQDINADFLVEWFRKEKDKIINTYLQGGQGNLSAQIIKELVVMIPSKEEQYKLGNYFTYISRLITLHQRKCDETKQLKKFMLQKMFPKNGEKNPEIRFEGFTDDWEQRKLGEVAEYRNGKAHENEIDEDGEYIVVNSKFVSTNAEIRKFSNAQNEPLYENEIAFVLSDVPNGRAIARTFLVDKSGKYTLNQRIAGITPHENTDPYYLHIRMNRNAYFLKFDDGNKQTNLSIKDVLNYEDMYPSYKEQHKIGLYFRQLDHLITLHQRKCEKLKELKKFMLQNMFV